MRNFHIHDAGKIKVKITWLLTFRGKLYKVFRWCLEEILEIFQQTKTVENVSFINHPKKESPKICSHTKIWQLINFRNVKINWKLFALLLRRGYWKTFKCPTPSSLSKLCRWKKNTQKCPSVCHCSHTRTKLSVVWRLKICFCLFYKQHSSRARKTLTKLSKGRNWLNEWTMRHRTRLCREWRKKCWMIIFLSENGIITFSVFHFRFEAPTKFLSALSKLHYRSQPTECVKNIAKAKKSSQVQLT